MSPLAQSLQTQIQRYSILVKSLQSGAHGKDVHELRTLSRRLRAEFWVLKKSSDIKVPPEIIRLLRKLTRSLGDARQLHVLYKDAIRYNLSVKKIARERQLARKKIAELLYCKWQRRLFEDLEEFEKNFLRKKSHINKVQARKLLKAEAQFLNDSKTPKSDKKWHERRVAMRKLQYRMEALGMRPRPLQELQGSLGKAHDLHLLKTMFPKKTVLARDEKKALAKAQRSYKDRIQKTLSVL